MQDSLVGTILDNRYEILSLLGEGGMGAVYKARHTLMQRLVAIRLLRSSPEESAVTPEAFRTQAAAVCALSHPNIVAVHDFGTSEQGQPYLAMDYVKGSTLAERIRVNGPLPVERALPMFLQISGALAYAHRKGVAHGNLWSGNVMLADSDPCPGFVRIADFGLASAQADAGADIYALGCIMQETLTGTAPGLETPSMSPPREKVEPPALKEIISRALAPSAQDRYQSMDYLASALETLGGKLTDKFEIRPGVSRRGGAAGRERAKAIWAASAAMALVVIVSGLAWFWLTGTLKGQIAGRELSLRVYGVLSSGDNARATAILEDLTARYTADHDLNNAIRCCRELIPLLYDSDLPTRERLASVHERLALLYLARGDRPRALAAIDQAYATANAVVSELYLTHKVAAARGPAESLLKAADQLLAPDDPRLSQACRWLGDAYMDSQQWQKAEAPYRRVVNIGDRDLQAGQIGKHVASNDLFFSYYGYAGLRRQQKRYGEAEALLKKAIAAARSEQYISGWRFAAYQELAGVYRDAGRDDDVLATYQQCLDDAQQVAGLTNAEYCAIKRWIAGYYFRRGRFPLAERCYKQAMANASRTGVELEPAFYDEYKRCLQAEGKTSELEKIEARP